MLSSTVVKRLELGAQSRASVLNLDPGVRRRVWKTGPTNSTYSRRSYGTFNLCITLEKVFG